MEISMIPDERGHRGQRCPAVYPTFGRGGGRGGGGGGEAPGVDFFLKIKMISFLSFERVDGRVVVGNTGGEGGKSEGGTSRVEEETQINEV